MFALKNAIDVRGSRVGTIRGNIDGQCEPDGDMKEQWLAGTCRQLAGRLPPCQLRTGRSPRPGADAPDGGTILLFTPTHTSKAGKKLGTLGWVEGRTKTQTKKTRRQREDRLGRHREKSKETGKGEEKEVQGGKKTGRKQAEENRIRRQKHEGHTREKT